jgi:hypothetical protein
LTWSGREHRAEHGDDGVEARVIDGQRLGVALDELDVEALGLRPLAAALEERRHVVDAGDMGAEPRRGDRRVAGPGRDVEDAPAGVQVGAVGQVLGSDLDPRGDRVVVPGGPGRLLASLDGGEVWEWWWWRCCSWRQRSQRAAAVSTGPGT